MSRWQVHRRAEDLLDLRRPHEAERMLRDHLAGDAEDATALALLAQALHSGGREVDAERAVRSALRLEPEMHFGYLVLTDLLVARSDRAGAETAAREAIRLHPEQWTSHYALAKAMTTGRRPRWRDALDVALHAVHLAPHSASTHNLAGICFGALNDRARARSAFEEALRLEPEHYAAANLAALDAESGKLKRGTQRVTAALHQQPTEGALHDVLDHLVLRFCRRMFLVVLLAALVLGIEVAAQAPWLLRAGTGVLMLVVAGWLASGFARHLPRGMTRWSRETFRRIQGLAWGFLALLGIALSALILMSFAPASLAATAGLGLLGVLRTIGALLFVGMVIGAFVNLVRGR